MAQGIARGESTTAIAKRFEKIGVSEGAAAKRLARTMIGGAQNGGKQAAMQRASASGIIMGKLWKAFHDARTRDSHIMLDNEIVAVDDAFSNGCRYPRDPGGAPGEICNCRCTMSGKVMGFRHADGSVTMVDMSVNCTEMPEGVFPPGYTYSQWKQDAQNRITAKQLREEELAAAENPGYGNSLLKKGRNSGIFQSNGKVGDTIEDSVIVKSYQIEPTNEKIVSELKAFGNAYAYAPVEHSLVITPDGRCFEVRGGVSAVHTEVVGAENLKGSIVIHNHPLDEYSSDFYDSFSIEDMQFAVETESWTQYLVSGKLKNSVVIDEKMTVDEITQLFFEARNEAYQLAFDSGADMEGVQLCTLREMAKKDERIKFNEY